MKKLLVLVAICLMFSGCDDNYDSRQNFAEKLTSDLRIATYNGHEYVILACPDMGGITHNPDCPCQKEKK